MMTSARTGDPACEDTVVITFTPNPSLTIDKVETSTGPYVVGNTLTYNIVVTNTGNVTLTNVTVADSAAVLGACVPAERVGPGAIGDDDVCGEPCGDADGRGRWQLHEYRVGDG